MATTDEILEQMENNPELYAADQEEICTIDNDLRTITVPSGLQTVGVESDEDVRRLNFQMPKQYHEVDLSEFNIRINFMNANNQGDVYAVTDKSVSGDNITFSWLVGRNALAYRGSIRFIVCLKKTDAEGVVQQEFNTTIAQLTVLEGLETTEAVVAENPDVIEQILTRLDELEENGGGSGTPGKDGREIELQNNGAAIQWRYAGDDEWTDLVQLSDLKGEGIPEGGTTGQVLTKQSDTDGEVVWKDITILDNSITYKKLQGLSYQGIPDEPVGNIVNLFDKNTMVVDGHFINPQGKPDSKANSKYAKIPVEPNTTYTVHKRDDGASDDFAPGNWGSVSVVNDSGSVLGVFSNITMGGELNVTRAKGDIYGMTFTTTDNAAYVQFTLQYNNGLDTTNTAMLETGDTCHEYVAYSSASSSNPEETGDLSGCEISKIFNANLIDEMARKSIEEIETQTGIGDFTNIKWAVLGDSISDNVQTSEITYYFEIISQKLGIDVTCLARSGNAWNTVLSSQVPNIPSGTQLVTIMAGTNDLGTSVGEITDTEGNSLYALMYQVVSQITNDNPGVSIGIITPVPRYDSDQYHTKVTQISDAIKNFCEYYSIPCLDLNKGSGITPFNVGTYYKTDKLHPNDAGQEKMSKKIEPFIKTLL